MIIPTDLPFRGPGTPLKEFRPDTLSKNWEICPCAPPPYNLNIFSPLPTLHRFLSPLIILGFFMFCLPQSSPPPPSPSSSVSHSLSIIYKLSQSICYKLKRYTSFTHKALHVDRPPAIVTRVYHFEFVFIEACR